MTLDEMIMEEIERVPRAKQTDLQQKYVDLYKEKEHYRYEMIAQEKLKDKWKTAYEKLKERYDKLIEKHPEELTKKELELKFKERYEAFKKERGIK